MDMTTKDNWYKKFFNGLALELWDQAIPENVTKQEVTFVEEICELTHGHSILDIPCGSGRHAIEFSLKGYTVTGWDISPGNIQTLKVRAAEKGVVVASRCADFLEEDLPGGFDLVICLGNSFSYFPMDRLKIFAHKICQSLNSSGKLVINTGALAESIIPHVEENSWMEVGNIFFLMKHEYQVDSSVLKTEMKFVRGSEKETRTAYHFVYTYESVVRMLKDVGFKTVNAWSGVDKGKFLLGSQQAYLLASK
jgi:SAM-dependent methyltransferase